MMNELVLESSSLPQELLQWLESGKDNTSLFFVRKENGMLIFRRITNPDLGMMKRVQDAADKYRPALEQLAQS